MENHLFRDSWDKFLTAPFSSTASDALRWLAYQSLLKPSKAVIYTQKAIRSRYMPFAFEVSPLPPFLLAAKILAPAS